VINNYLILLLALQLLGLYYMNSFATFDNGGFASISPAKATEFVYAPPCQSDSTIVRSMHLCVRGSSLGKILVVEMDIHHLREYWYANQTLQSMDHYPSLSHTRIYIH